MAVEIIDTSTDNILENVVCWAAKDQFVKLDWMSSAGYV
jgi:hypothetical protein